MFLFFASSPHEVEIDKTFPSPPPLMSSCLYYICECPFTDGCFDISMPSGMNDFDIASLIAVTIAEADSRDWQQLTGGRWFRCTLHLFYTQPPYAILIGSLLV